MAKSFHILNGDALREKFPSSLIGEIIVFRECLVDGDINGDSDQEFYQSRAQFISKAYGDVKPERYFEITVSELEKIKQIPQESSVYLWFEDDLFCQVNCWYVLHQLSNQHHSGEVILVRPFTRLEYGFGGLDMQGLKEAFERGKFLSNEEFLVLSKMWKAYLSKNDNELYDLVNELPDFFSYLLEAVKAEVARRPSNGDFGRPEQSIINIIEELQTDEFAPVFREFCKRESIYGFGDLQVKNLLEKVKNSK
ncbi:DUF1835 domain-containing protein [Echinicola marina]|uniref:DUF1835 domain-containing protein n=1 Tax=Echinicola marina TaxID=2859768 RepID=UPI001CF6F473|nr:DUF1835 domain-containing protein [Echinicola marina]UCS94599.1 DUF1835 domain-containing protein [Echinicola marina]